MNRYLLDFTKVLFKSIPTFCFLLYFIFLTGAEATVLITYDAYRGNREIVSGIKKQVKESDPDVVDVKITTADEFNSVIKKTQPSIVIILGEKTVRNYKNYTLTEDPNRDIVPSISVIPRYVQQLDDIPNNTGIYYEVPVSLCVEKLSAFTGEKIIRIGIIHRPYLEPFVRENKIVCEKTGLSIVNYSLPESDPNLVSNINRYLNKLKRSDMVDALYIPDDEVLLRPGVIQDAWKQTLLKFPMSVVVCNQSYLESDEGMSTLCIMPDYKAIGVSIGKKIKEIEKAEWKLNSRGLSQATFYKTVRNGKKSQVAYAASVAKKTKQPAMKSENQPGESTTAISQGNMKNDTGLVDPVIKIQEAQLIKPSIVQANNASHHYPVTNSKQLVADLQDILLSVQSADTSLQENRLALSENMDAVAEKTLLSKPEHRSDKNKKEKVNKKNTLVTMQKLSAREDAQVIKKVPTSTPNVQHETVATSSSDTFNEKNNFSASIIFSIIAAMIILFIIIFRIANKVKKRQNKSSLSEKTCVIITTSVNDNSHFLYDDRNETIDGFMSSNGFKVHTVRNMQSLEKILINTPPDVLFVNWEFSSTIHSYICTQAGGPVSIIIFFNITDFHSVERDSQFENVYYMGKIFFMEELRQILIPTLSGKQVKALSDSSNKPVRSNIEGDIFDDSLLDFFQLIDIGRKTGCLIVEQEIQLGMIFFEYGRITYAVTAECKGYEAVYEILGLTQGRFKFQNNLRTEYTNLDVTVMEIIMDWARVQDEFSKSVGTAIAC